MRRLAILLMAALGAALPSRSADAGLTARQLEEVRAAPAAGARLDLGTPVRDLRGGSLTLAQALGGRPGLLVPVDYHCRVLCGPVLTLLGPILSRTRNRTGRDFVVLVLGMDPRDDGTDALDLARAQLGTAAETPGLRVLSAGAPALASIFGALGYGAVYDADAERFAHPAAGFALAPDGRVVRTLSTLALDATDLDLAITEARGEAAPIQDRLVLLCYGFDPVQGLYSPLIHRALAAAGAATLLALAGGLLCLARRSRRSLDAR